MRLGYPHPDYLLPRLTGRQLADWQRYAAQFGIGPERADIYHAMLLSMFHNVHRESSWDSKPASDFLVWDRPDPFEEELSQEDFVARIRSITPCQPSQI